MRDETTDRTPTETTEGYSAWPGATEGDHRETAAVLHPHLMPFLQGDISRRYRLVELSLPPSPFRPSEARTIIVDGSRPFDKGLSAAMPRLGLIACFNAGHDGIDIDWAARHGIMVTHAWQANHEDVADFAIGQILNICRMIEAGDRYVRNGEWQSGWKPMARSVNGLKLGIVGLGSIGTALARRADTFGMTTAWWGPRDKPGVRWPKAASLIELARASDVLVVASSANPGNAKMISAEVLHALGPDGVIVNVGRGSLVDEDALIAALRRGALGAAALDVFQQEPTPAARWADVPNVYLTPHIAGVTDLAVKHMAAQLLANLDAFFDGMPVLTPVSALG